MTNSPPSRNTASDDTLIGVLHLLRDKMKQNTDDMLPAKVIAYDRTTNRAQVQPLIMMVNTRNEILNRAQIASVPVLQVGGGGFVISFPLIPGDLGWIKASDRDISLFKANYAAAAPNTQRTHNFSDAMFIPDSFMKDVVINGEDAGNLVIQNLDSTVRIAIWPDKVKITAPEVIVVAPEVTVIASTEITLDTPLTTCTGDLVVEGDISTDGNITGHGSAQIDGSLTANVDVIANGTHLHTHTHGGVMTGGSNTGAPN